MRSKQLLLNSDEADPIAFETSSGLVYLLSCRSPDREGLNQDSAAVFSLADYVDVLVVADGAGGCQAGDQASCLAIEAFSEILQGFKPRNGELRSAILDAFELANRRILELGVGAASTLAVAELSSGFVRTYHAGDSVVMVTGQRGKLKLQTVSHSPVGYGVESGLLDEAQAMHHAERHLVSNMLGAADMRIEVSQPLRLAARDTVVVASDGVTDNLHMPDLIEFVRSGDLATKLPEMREQLLTRMQKPTNGAPSKPDDFSLILLRPSAESLIVSTRQLELGLTV